MDHCAEKEFPDQNMDMMTELVPERRKVSFVADFKATVQGLNHPHELDGLTVEDLVFNLFSGGKAQVSIGALVKLLKNFGLRETDPRLKAIFEYMKKIEESDQDSRSYLLDKETFRDCVRGSFDLISLALRHQLIIPSWIEHTATFAQIFHECTANNKGEVADYIPQLKRQDANWWGMSICTISGQRFSLGDAKTPFCLQSVSKAINYAIASSALENIHEYVGYEPSGRNFNDICLDSNNKPHNPMINSGAIIVTALLQGKTMADKFDNVMREYKKMAGGEHIGFNNATFLSERDTADRNYALSYYMKENNCFPESNNNIHEVLDLYFQLCSVEVNCETAAVMAATLANGGVCPLTEELCITPQACRDTLSLMYSCGMYDFSGKFAFKVGLPAKSGVSGVMLVVVPNVMGIALFSPRLDKGNSCRGVEFCKKLIETFNFHNYDSLIYAESNKIDPRRKIDNNNENLIVQLFFAAKSGELDKFKRAFLSVMMRGQEEELEEKECGAVNDVGGKNSRYHHKIDINVLDYDGRTALHIAASEGHLHLVKFLIENAGAKDDIIDRYGNTPLDNARMFQHDPVLDYLLNYKFKKQQINFSYKKSPEVVVEDHSSPSSAENDSFRRRLLSIHREEDD